MASLLCAALDGVVRAAILEDPQLLSDPQWVDQVVAFTTAAIR